MDSSYAKIGEREAKRQAVEKSLKEGGDTTSAAQTMENIETLIDEFPTSVTVSE